MKMIWYDIRKIKFFQNSSERFTLKLNGEMQQKMRLLTIFETSILNETFRIPACLPNFP